MNNESQSSTIGDINRTIGSVLRFIVNICVPGEFTAKAIVEIIWEYKFVFLGIVVTLAICCCSFLTALLFPNISSEINGNLDNMPTVLATFIELGYSQDGSPHNSPLGDLTNIMVTAYFDDQNYFYYYHKWHKGIDLIPSSIYYTKNEAYKLLGDTVLFATCNGTASSLQDAAGANYIYIVCADNIHAVFIVHNKYNFIPLGDKAIVVAGQPVAVMGNTGNSTGAHVHYAIKNLITGEYVDPFTSLR